MKCRKLSLEEGIIHWRRWRVLKKFEFDCYPDMFWRRLLHVTLKLGTFIDIYMIDFALIEFVYLGDQQIYCRCYYVLRTAGFWSARQKITGCFTFSVR